MRERRVESRALSTSSTALRWSILAVGLLASLAACWNGTSNGGTGTIGAATNGGWGGSGSGGGSSGAGEPADAEATDAVSLEEGGGTCAGSTGCQLGSTWSETESNGTCSSTFTRQGLTDSFLMSQTCGAGSLTADLTIMFSGSDVTISRTNSSDGNECTYSGTLSGDCQSVSGTYTCTTGYAGAWSATISGGGCIEPSVPDASVTDGGCVVQVDRPNGGGPNLLCESCLQSSCSTQACECTSSTYACTSYMACFFEQAYSDIENEASPINASELAVTQCDNAYGKPAGSSASPLLDCMLTNCATPCDL